jgi:hypothetical protein
VRAVMLGGAPGIGKTAAARRLLRLAEAGPLLVQWVDVDALWLHQPWRTDEPMTSMLRANLRAVADNGARAGVDVLVITWVFQSVDMHRLVLSLLPAGTAAVSVQLHASEGTWRRRFEADPERPPVSEFYQHRYEQAQDVAADHVVDTDGLTPGEIAGRVATAAGLR